MIVAVQCVGSARRPANGEDEVRVERVPILIFGRVSIERFQTTVLWPVFGARHYKHAVANDGANAEGRDLNNEG